MDRKSIIVIHCNPGLYNQVLYSRYIKDGFNRLGYTCEISSNPNEIADIHVVIGPHFAFRENVGKNTIYIDRCLWGDDLEAVTIGWLNNDGGMIYPEDAPNDRSKPDLQPWIEGDGARAMLLMDYGPYPLDICHQAKKHYGSVTYRPHPATGKKMPDLLGHLEGHSVAIGFRTSALFTAAINGYPVISFDNRSPVYNIAGHDILDIKYPDRKQWLNNMSYAQWGANEIQNGEALEYVVNSANERAVHAIRS